MVAVVWVLGVVVIRCIISLSVIGMIGKTFLSYCYCDGVAFDTEQFNLP